MQAQQQKLDFGEEINYQINTNLHQVPQVRRRKSSMDYLIPYVGIDIGGTLIKLCIAFQKGSQNSIDFSHIENLKIETHEQFNVYFEVFPTNDLSQLFRFIEKQSLGNITQKFYISGGGAHKYKDIIEKTLNINVIQVPEMESLSKGLKVLDMLLPNDSVYEFDKKIGNIRYIEQTNWVFPLILVQIGSGVSILKVKNQNEFERISGTSCGGNMFLGISYLLTKINDFDKLLSISTNGNNKNTDLYVSDIYKQISAVPEDIYGDALCVSFGRVKKMIKQGKEIKKEDLVKSALQMVAFNISQIAFLIATIHKITNIFFTGYFIKNHKDTIETIEYAIDYFCKSQHQQKKAYFLKHDGFLGALGSFYKAFTSQSQKNTPVSSNNNSQVKFQNNNPNNNANNDINNLSQINQTLNNLKLQQEQVNEQEQKQ